jgi:hypothetical protein
MLCLAQLLLPSDDVLWDLSVQFPVRFSKDLVSGFLNRCKGVPVYEEDKSLTIWLRLPIKYPPVLGVKPWVNIFYSF